MENRTIIISYQLIIQLNCHEKIQNFSHRKLWKYYHHIITKYVTVTRRIESSCNVHFYSLKVFVSFWTLCIHSLYNIIAVAKFLQKTVLDFKSTHTNIKHYNECIDFYTHIDVHSECSLSLYSIKIIDG